LWGMKALSFLCPAAIMEFLVTENKYPVANMAIHRLVMGLDVDLGCRSSVFCADCGSVDENHDYTMAHPTFAVNCRVGSPRYTVDFNDGIEREVIKEEWEYLMGWLNKHEKQIKERYALNTALNNPFDDYWSEGYWNGED